MRSLRNALLSLLVLSMLVPAPLWAAFALVGSQANCVSGNLFAGTTAYVYTYPAALTSGSLAYLAVGTETRTVSSISGTGASYTINGANTPNATAGENLSQWIAVTSAAGTTATITLSGATSSPAYVCFLEFSGNASDQSISVANGAFFDATSGANHNSGSVTPPTASNVVIASMWRTSGTWTEDGAFTPLSTGTDQFYVGYIIQASATAQEYNAASVDPEYSALRIGAFAGAATALPRNLSLMGVGQ